MRKQGKFLKRSSKAEIRFARFEANLSKICLRCDLLIALYIYVVVLLEFSTFSRLPSLRLSFIEAFEHVGH